MNCYRVTVSLKTGIVDILCENGYYVAYVNGKVDCTADTYGEAVRELTDNGII